MGVFTPYAKGGYFPPPSFLWAIMALFIVCLAMKEEINLIKELGEDYRRYREETSFLIPLPSKIKKIIAFPLKATKGKWFPGNNKEVFYVFIIYFFILVGISYPLISR